jgi:PAS domain S-box-containing protein
LYLFAPLSNGGHVNPEQEKDAAKMAGFQDKLEQAEREGPERFAAAWAAPSPGVGCHEIDLKRVMRRVNGEELRILGYREDQLIGQSVVDLIVMQDTAQRAIDDKFSGARELKPFVRTFKRADGTPITLLLLDRHIKDAEGRVVGLRTSMMEARLAR